MQTIKTYFNRAPFYNALIRTCTILDRHDLHRKIVYKWAQGCLNSPRVGRYAAGPETTTHSQTISRYWKRLLDCKSVGRLDYYLRNYLEFSEVYARLTSRNDV